jgi:hypothetical protein
VTRVARVAILTFHFLRQHGRDGTANFARHGGSVW